MKTIPEPRYISPADTAKLVRAALKAAFPTIKFSVRSRRYSGGASVDVSWMDGPTTREVELIAKRFEGATFDGMVDLKSNHDSTLDGERVRFGADFVMCDRSFSPDFVRRRAATVAAQWGEPVEVTINRHGGVDLVGSYEMQDRVWQAARRTRGVC